MAAADNERLRREEEDRQNLLQRGRRVHEEILQTKMGDQNVFTTPPPTKHPRGQGAL